jgi:integrase/recombinase XerD
MKNADYLRKFEEYLTDEEKSRSTINSYVGDSKEFLKFAKKEIGAIKSADVITFKEHLRKKGLKVLSINKKLVGVKQFIDFVNDRYSLGVTARVKQEKVQKQYSLKDEELLSPEDYNRLIAAVKESGDTRAEALFETMFYTGMRVSEALQLRIDHIEQEVRIIEDIKGKGSKYRDIFICDELIPILKKYLQERQQPYSSTTKALFVGERGPITRHTAHRLIKKYAEKANVEEKKAHVHNLRHRFCLDLAEEGYQIQDIAKFAGHESIEVTKKYLEKTQSEYMQMLNNRKRKQLS